MRIHATLGARSRRSAVTLAMTAALAAALTACSSSGGTGTATTKPHAAAAAAPATSSPAPAASNPAPPAAASGLTGTWRGQYGGAYQGTFVLRWRQSGTDLSGGIQLSNPGGTLPIHGTLSGGSIKFGTVGSTRITYTGTVSGTSMSGNWQINGSGQGGNWSASKG